MEAPKGIERLEEAAGLLPYDLRQAVLALPDGVKARTEEFRLRAGRPPMLSDLEGERPLPGREGTVVGAEDFGLILEIASQASAHTVLDRVQNGFLTIKGGHRLGLCGSAVVKDGEVHNLRQISSLAIRVAREATGVAAKVLGELVEAGALQSTLILSPPGGGKTTLLRDLIRCLSAGEGTAPLRVGVADERGELASLYRGVPQLDVGPRTDVMDGCPKAAGLMMLLRGMNPQVLAADEVTAPEDIAALESCAGCGVKLLATAHGGGPADLWTRPLYRRLMEADIFRRVVVIGRTAGGRTYRVTTPEEGRPC